MNTPKAISILKDIINDEYPLDIQDYKDATQLGIEALERHQSKATLTHSSVLLPLPSETLEEAGEG